MQITRQADYALRAVIFLSRLNGDQKASTSVIAEDQKIPPSFLAKIVSQLSIAGLIQTSRGARGGVSLAKSPEDISVLDVIEAIDGPVLLNECAKNPENCPFGDSCPLQSIWSETREELVNRLSSATFSRANIT
jgi:Rrf2 family protein